MSFGEVHLPQDFRKLLVWQKAHDLTLAIYSDTARFPREESFGLTSQLRRAASSIGSNIAEGCGRGSTVDMRRFLNMSRGSANEVDYQLQLATDLKMLDREVYVLRAAAVVEIQKMLKALIATLGVPASRR